MKINTLISLLLILLSTSCSAEQDKIDLFIMDYPHGEQRLHAKRTGEAYLYYGERPSAKIIRTDTFSVEELYTLFQKHLHPISPREQWANPKSQAGMVTIRYTNGKELNYLIFDVNELTDGIFMKANQNIIGENF